jgi:quercetin dioxygenase-like cupin family protein
MNTRGFVVPASGGSVVNSGAGRFEVLKLLREETGGSIMLFEEIVPTGTDTTMFHLHRDSDEIAYVLSGEITFQIGEEVTVGGPGTCAFIPVVRHMHGKTVAPKPLAWCSFTPRPAQVGFSRNYRGGRRSH